MLGLNFRSRILSEIWNSSWRFPLWSVQSAPEAEPGNWGKGSAKYKGMDKWRPRTSEVGHKSWRWEGRRKSRLLSARKLGKPAGTASAASGVLRGYAAVQPLPLSQLESSCPFQTDRGLPPFPEFPTDSRREAAPGRKGGNPNTHRQSPPPLGQSCPQLPGAAAASGPRPAPTRPRSALPWAPGGGRGPGQARPAAAAAPVVGTAEGRRSAEDCGSPKSRRAPGRPYSFQHHQPLPLPPTSGG